METQKSCCDVVTEINNLRKAMIATGMSKGLNDRETLKYSQELDKLILRWQLILRYQVEC
ncbi:hypothetical protein AC623_16755 [Bacillus sp. FJAT-27231]|uniref:aspartyl-phosphate phosphatase Spo0E family protein n=1 Tax=Bacillus sp. FJAT-27231 TaxID=1679168 RepID=UPI0006715211|nr:aspartyl-phosphate phosphatase Spo0E family protein [Bacillus sp. FJAT-27231]KMY55385.1 hypothetical protein AC623_16755 [Bacillus sp. FJAT-27231]